MTDVTRILSAIDAGDESAAEQLLPLVYTELRKLAHAKLRNEHAGQSLQPTMLVHDAYVRLVDVDTPQEWNSRGHFFAAAAEAMRRILIENARRKAAGKHGGQFQQVDLDLAQPADVETDVDLLALDEALMRLEERWPDKAKLVKLRFYAGLSVCEAANAIGVSRATAERYWTFARTWLYAQLTTD